MPPAAASDLMYLSQLHLRLQAKNSNGLRHLSRFTHLESSKSRCKKFAPESGIPGLLRRRRHAWEAPEFLPPGETADQFHPIPVIAGGGSSLPSDPWSAVCSGSWHLLLPCETCFGLQICWCCVGEQGPSPSPSTCPSASDPLGSGGPDFFSTQGLGDPD